MLAVILILMEILFNGGRDNIICQIGFSPNQLKKKIDATAA
jgi:hypothetical protein